MSRMPPTNFMPGESAGIPDEFWRKQHPLFPFLRRLKTPAFGGLEMPTIETPRRSLGQEIGGGMGYDLEAANQGFAETLPGRRIPPETLPMNPSRVVPPETLPMNPARSVMPEALANPAPRSLEREMGGERAYGMEGPLRFPEEEFGIDAAPPAAGLPRNLARDMGMGGLGNEPRARRASPHPVRIGELEEQLAALQPKMPTTKMGWLGQVLKTFAPAIAGGLAGGLEGAAGAVEGTLEAQESERTERQRAQQSATAQLEAERDRQATFEQRSLAEDLEREKMAEQIRQFTEQQAQRRNEFGQTEARIQSEGEAGRSLQRDIEERRRQQLVPVPQGTALVSPTTNQPVFTNPARPPDVSFEEATYEDYLKSPESLKFGATRIGYDRYKQQQRITAAHASRAPVGMMGELTPRQLQASLQLSNSLKAHPAYVDMLDIDTGLQGVDIGLSQKNGFGDITAINAFQRMVDPGATVREGDVALLQSATGMLQRILSEYPIEQLRSGAKLPDSTRELLRTTAKQLYERRARNYNETVGQQYRGLSKAAGIPFEYIGQDFQVGAAARVAPETPPGMVRVKHADGRTGMIPLDQLPAAEKDGFRRIP